MSKISQIVYVFKTDDEYLKSVQGTYCEVVLVRNEKDRGVIDVKPLNDSSTNTQRVLYPNMYQKLRKRYTNRYLGRLYELMEQCRVKVVA